MDNIVGVGWLKAMRQQDRLVRCLMFLKNNLRVHQMMEEFEKKEKNKTVSQCLFFLPFCSDLWFLL